MAHTEVTDSKSGRSRTLGARLRSLGSGVTGDVICLLLIAISNPLVHSRQPTSHRLQKDAIAYISFGRNFFADFSLTLPSWAHIDTGTILPPVYPLLIAVGSTFTDDLILLAQALGCYSLLFSVIPLFLLMRSFTNRLLATCAIVAVQLHVQYAAMSFMGLTEGPFVLATSLTFLVLVKCIDTDRTIHAVLLGLLCAIAFLTRQIGLLLLPFCICWIAISGFAAPSTAGKVVQKIVLVALGFAAIFTLYAGMLYGQTGQHPFQQSFRLGIYSVATEDPQVLAEIEQIKTHPVGEYQQLYRQRRQLFKLTPDSREMYRFVAPTNHQDRPSPVIGAIRSKLSNPSGLVRNLGRDLGFLYRSLGAIPFVLFIVAVVTPIIVRRSPVPHSRRLLVLGFIATYLLALSLFDGLVARYVSVLFPFVLLHIAIEAYVVCQVLVPTRARAALAAAGVVALVVITMPRFSLLPDNSDAAKPDWPQRALANEIRPGDPVFVLHPFDSYLLGGNYRILPNAALDQVAEYGRQTGVEWILIADTPFHRNEIQLYTGAPWYENWDLIRALPGEVELRREIERGSSRYGLVRILPNAAE